MNLYHSLLLLINQGNEPITKHRLITMAHGRYKSIVQNCINQGLIVACDKNTLGEDLYFVTEKGKAYLDNPKEELK